MQSRIDRRLLLGAAAATVAVRASSTARAQDSTAITWLLNAILTGDNTGAEDFVTRDIVVSSHLVNGSDEFGWWIIEANARLNQSFTEFRLDTVVEMYDEDWYLSFSRLNAVVRDSGDEQSYDWHLAAKFRDGRIEEVNLAGRL